MSAIDPKRTLSFLGHLVLYEPNDRCDDRPSDAAANCLTEESTNIHAAGCIAQHRQKRGEDLTSDAASNCARDGVARRAEAHVLRRRARCIATECTGYNLNYEIDAALWLAALAPLGMPEVRSRAGLLRLLIYHV